MIKTSQLMESQKFIRSYYEQRRVTFLSLRWIRRDWWKYEFVCIWKENDQKWIIVDMGVSFADESVPGVDIIMPDAGFIIDKKDDLLGIVLTHAHEDHIGAVTHIWPHLKM